MQQYFELIRTALSENRIKGVGIYYEAHHIIPQSFNKKSSTVLLTPEEHYLAHKYLAEFWKEHTAYGKKMLWAFHRLAYDKGRELTKEQYGEARRVLMALWTRKRTDNHKENIAKTRRGKKTIVHPDTREIKYVSIKDLPNWLNLGWENTNYTKGKKDLISNKGRKKLAEARVKHQTGKVGLQAQAAKGPYTVEYDSGEKFTAGSYPELSKISGIKYSTLQHRYTTNKGKMIRGWKIE